MKLITTESIETVKYCQDWVTWFLFTDDDDDDDDDDDMQ